MKNLKLHILLLTALITGCSGSSNNTADETVSDEEIIPISIALQASRLKSHEGFNQLNSALINDSYRMLTDVENMLKSLTDSKDVLIDSIASLLKPFALTTGEAISTNQNVSSTTPPFTIGIAGLNSDFLLLSSNSRFFSPKNTIKTRFTNSVELSSAWLRAVEYSDQTCVYIALQSVDTNGNVSSASNTLVVVLDPNAAKQCAMQI